jgi:hypothetical protein
MALPARPGRAIGIPYVTAGFHSAGDERPENASWAHEQCLPLIVQILTKRGWLRYDEVLLGDLTVGYNSTAGRSEWTPVRQIHVYDDAPLIRLSDKPWAATCMPHHCWPAVHWRLVGYKGREGRTKNEYARRDVLVEAQRITSRHSLRLAAPARLGDGPAIGEHEAELLGWVLGDGWVVYLKSRTPDSTHWRTLRGTRPSIRLGQAKPEHVKAIDRLVAGLPFTRTVRKMRKPGGGMGLPLVTWEFHRPYSAELLKRSGYDHQSPVPFVLSLSESQRESFLRGVFGAEGTRRRDGPIKGQGSYPSVKTYSRADGSKQDAIVLAIYLSGMRPGIHVRTGNAAVLGCESPRTIAVISETKPFIGGQSIKREDAGRSAVWCVTTDLGTWTMRMGRQVMLTGGWYE